VIVPATEDVPQIGVRQVWPFPIRTSKEQRWLFASGAEGSAEAEWIEADRLYRFSLYPAASEDRALASVSVTREDIVSMPNDSDETLVQNGIFITAAPNPVPMGREPGETVISWSTGDGSPGTIYVSIEDQQMRYPTDGPDAIEQVERLRKKGAEFLIAPLKACGLFEQYPKLKEYLDTLYRVVEDDEFCRIYDLRETIQKPVVTGKSLVA
jgi:hypothetical protein